MSEGRRFEIRGLLGKGGFGRVYLAELMSLGGFRKQVALKVLDPNVTTNVDAAQRLRDEARLLGLLRHQNIVAVDDLVRFDEGWGVVMEYVAGVDLGVLLTDHARRGETFSPRAAAELARAVAKALDAAYTAAPPGGEPLRAIHRDIKPGNVRITPEGQVKVLDFGIARAEFQAREAVTGDGNYGSLAYMSPERVMGDGDTAAGDVYALGVVLWESLLCRPRGRALLRREKHDEQVAEMLAAVEHEGLRTLIAEMVAFDCEGRPSAHDVVERLRALQAVLPGAELEQVARQRVPALMAPPVAADVSALVSLQGPSTDSTTMDFGAVGFSPPTAVPPAAGPDASPPPPTGPVSLAPLPPPVAPRRGTGPGIVLAGVLGVLVAAGIAIWGPFSGPSPARSAAGSPPPVAAPRSPSTASPAAATTAPPPEPAPVEPPPEQPAAAPAPPRPESRPPTAAPARATASAPAPAAEAAPAPASAGPRLRAVKFAASGVDRIQARCGDVSGSGATSALVRDLPAGPCSVTVQAGGTTLKTRVQVDVPRGFRCAVTAGVLACQ